MKSKLKIGYLTSLSGRWPRELPNERQDQYATFLTERYDDLAEFIMLESIVGDADSLGEAIKLFKRESVDVIIQVYGAFTGDDVSTQIAEEMNVPLILWAPYEPEYHGGRIMSNALVALTMNMASLKRLNHTCYGIYGGMDDGRAIAELDRFVKVYAIINNLKGTKFGLFGYRPTAFYNSAFDEGLIRRTFGIRFEETELAMVVEKMNGLEEEAVKADMEKVAGTYTMNLPEGYLENHSRLYLALQSVVDDMGYDYATIKCWPEMGQLKMTPCAVMGRLADENIGITCESDVDVALAAYVQNMLTDEPSFVTDMIDINEEKNTLRFWHCGNPAPSLFEKKPSMNDHPLAGQGSAFYGTLKPGKVTVSRLCNIGGVYKLFISKGEAVPTTANITGAMVDVKIERPVRDYVYGLFDNEIPHHYSLTWTDVSEELKLMAQVLGIEIIEL